MPAPLPPPSLVPFKSEQETHLKPAVNPRVIGPSGTLDTDSHPALVPADSASATFTGDEGQSASSSGSNAPPPPPPDAPGRTQDFKPVAPPAKSFVPGLDEARFRRAVWGLAAGAVALVVLTFIWVMVKYDDRPADPGAARPIAVPKGMKPQPKQTPAPAAVVDVPKAVMIEQTVDAGAGETRTVLAAAGTARIVTDPECTVTVEGRDLGVTPVLVTLPAGKNQVVLENKKLLFKRTVTVEVQANEQTAVRFAFSKGWIELDAPKESTVNIDGRAVTGKHIQVWEGTHHVEAVHADKKRSRASRTVEVAAGMTTSVHFDAPSLADE
jgi:hypothetical protein